MVWIFRIIGFAFLPQTHEVGKYDESQIPATNTYVKLSRRRIDFLAIMSKVLTVLLLIIGFSIMTAVCYLWGYWGTFNIEIIEHIDLGSLMVIATVPLLGMAIMMLVAVSMASILSIDLRSDPKRAQSGNATGIRSFIRPEAIYTLSLLGIIIIVVIGGVAQWLLLAIPFAFFTTTFIVFNNIFEGYAINKRDLFFAVLIATLLPSLAFGFGKTKGLLIEQGIDFKKVISANNLPINANSDFRYLGSAGEYAFILDGHTNQTIIGVFEDLQPLVLGSSKTKDSGN